VLGRYTLETFLRSACLEWLYQTPCSYAGYLGVSTLHTCKINIVLPASSLISKTIEDLFTQCALQDPTGYPRILNIIDLRPLRGQHANKASLRSAPQDSLQPCWEIWVPLHFVRSRPWLGFLLFWIIKPAMLPASMLGDYSTSASSTPSCFPRRTDLSGNLFPITSLLDLLSFLLFWIIIPAIPPATILGYYSMSASLTPSKFFIVISIYWKPASYRSSLNLASFGEDYKQVGCYADLFLFLFGPTCILFDLSIALRLRHDLSKVDVHTPRSGACETWVPLVLHRPGSWSSPTSGSGLPEDSSTCQWAQPT
jgi:hypothetical protein